MSIQPLRVTPTTYRVSDFLSWQRAGTLRLSPSFQRRPVWPEAAKSYLVDTVVRGLPVPIIYIRERVRLDSLEPDREVVDGQQRLRTLISFIEPASLKDFDNNRDAFTILPAHNKALAARHFGRLSPAVRTQILGYEFSVHVLPSGTDDREVLQIFARLNSTGVKLNPQELRNAQFFGRFKRVCYDLAYEQLSRWRDWTIFTETDIARMLEVEFVSELLLLMQNGIRGKSQRSLDLVYEQHEKVFLHEDETERRFRAVMDAIDDAVGSELPRLQFSRQPLFHTLFTYFYDVQYGLNSRLSKAKSRRVSRGIAQCIIRASNRIETGQFPEELEKALRGRTTHRQSRDARFKFLRQVCSRASA